MADAAVQLLARLDEHALDPAHRVLMGRLGLAHRRLRALQEEGLCHRLKFVHQLDDNLDCEDFDYRLLKLHYLMSVEEKKDHFNRTQSYKTFRR